MTSKVHKSSQGDVTYARTNNIFWATVWTGSDWEDRTIFRNKDRKIHRVTINFEEGGKFTVWADPKFDPKAAEELNIGPDTTEEADMENLARMRSKIEMNEMYDDAGNQIGVYMAWRQARKAPRLNMDGNVPAESGGEHKGRSHA